MTNEKPQFIYPTWNAQKTIHAISTTRLGGLSQSPYQSLNLGAHVGDDLECVRKNRQRLLERAQLPSEPHWLEQCHSNTVLDVTKTSSRQADGSYTNEPDQVCVVMTADCLPILLCSIDGTEVAAIHGGWKGLAGNILSVALKHFRAKPNNILAWLGPAISETNYEIGQEVKDHFTAQNAVFSQAFTRSDDPSAWKMNLYALATLQLQTLGITQIFCEHRCTYQESSLFYSYRRDKQTGRMASLIWITHEG